MGGASASQTFTWTVAQPTVTVANPLDHDNVDGDSVDAAIYATDSGSGNTLTYSASGLPSGVSINTSTGVISGTIDSTADTSSPYSVTVTATDAAADVSGDTTFSWEVDPLVTLASPRDQTNCLGDTVALQVSAYDAAGNTLTYSEGGLPGGLSINSSTGEISGTIDDGLEIDSPYSVTLTATDSSADIAVSQSFNWTMVEINTANPGHQANLDGDSVDLTISASRSYASEPALSFSATGLPSGLSINSSTGVISGAVAGDADESSPYCVTVTATDSDADLSASASFKWDIAAPSASDFAVSTTTNQELHCIDLTQASNGPDDPSMSVDIASGPSHGSLTENDDGTYNYTPDTGFDGTDSFTYYVAVGDPVDSGTATVTVTVSDNTPTVGPTLSYSVLPGGSLTLNDLPANGSDAAGDAITAGIVSDPSHGSLSESGGVWVYTPTSGYSGSDSFTYDLSNGSQTSSTATVDITVGGSGLVVNPVLVQTGEDQAVAIAPSRLLANDMAPTGTPKLVSLTQPSNGTVMIDKSGNIIYSPDAGYTGSDSFNCVVQDGADTEVETVDLQMQGRLMADLDFTNIGNLTQPRRVLVGLASAAGPVRYYYVDVEPGANAAASTARLIAGQNAGQRVECPSFRATSLAWGCGQIRKGPQSLLRTVNFYDAILPANARPTSVVSPGVTVNHLGTFQPRPAAAIRARWP